MERTNETIYIDTTTTQSQRRRIRQPTLLATIAGSKRRSAQCTLPNPLLFLVFVLVENRSVLTTNSMEHEILNFGLSTASRSYQSRLKSQFELFIDFEDVDGDDELKTAYPCPFCADDFDLIELCCHIDLEHPIEANSGICPVCAMWERMNMVEHITTQHEDIFRSHNKSRRHHKLESYPTLSLSRKDRQDGHWQSFSTGPSPVMSTSKTAREPLLSFLYSAAAADERENVQSDSSNGFSIEELHSDDTVVERDVQPSLSEKDQIEKARHSEFAQGLLVSTILDPEF